jgi:hypothetical protein
MIRASADLQLDGGMLVAVPIPAAAAAEGAAIEAAIQESLAEADTRGIAGAEVSGHGRVGVHRSVSWAKAACYLTYTRCCYHCFCFCLTSPGHALPARVDSRQDGRRVAGRQHSAHKEQRGGRQHHRGRAGRAGMRQEGWACTTDRVTTDWL